MNRLRETVIAYPAPNGLTSYAEPTANVLPNEVPIHHNDTPSRVEHRAMQQNGTPVASAGQSVRCPAVPHQAGRYFRSLRDTCLDFVSAVSALLTDISPALLPFSPN